MVAIGTPGTRKHLSRHTTVYEQKLHLTASRRLNAWAGTKQRADGDKCMEGVLCASEEFPVLSSSSKHGYNVTEGCSPVMGQDNVGFPIEPQRTLKPRCDD